MTAVVRYGVWLYDNLIGHLDHRDNYTWFEFTPTYLGDSRRSVLGLRFEERLGSKYAANMVLPPWFSNLLPEGKLRDWIADDAGVVKEREMELLAEVGHDLPGAVRVLPADASFSSTLPHPESVIDPPSRTSAGGPWRMSLAGVGLKFSMLRDHEGQFTVPAYGRGGDWIVKLPDREFACLPLNEHTMMRFAGAVGIDVPEVALVHRDEIAGLPDHVWPNREEYAYAVRRFDRTSERGLVHIEDLAQVRDVYPSQKYEGNFETVASLIYRRSDEVALREFARRLAFFVLIGNGDGHLKNWSLIYRDRRRPTLSPAYDIVATEPYRPGEGPENVGLKFASSTRFSTIRMYQFEQLARRLGATSDLREVVETTVERTREAWPEFHDALDAIPLVRDGVATSIVERCRSVLGS